MRSPLLLAALCGVVSACTPAPRVRPSAVVEVTPATGWRAIASAEDAATIDALPAAWGRLRTLPARTQRLVTAEGALLDPAVAQDFPALPPGSYVCRAVRIEGERLLRFPDQFCFVRGEGGGRMSFNKQTGTDLPNGWLIADGDKRYVFLGAQQRAPGANDRGYGDDRAADRVGVVERIGAFRWRLVMPREAGRELWVYELTPVPPERQPEG